MKAKFQDQHKDATLRISTELRLQAYEFSAAYVEKEYAIRKQKALKKCISNEFPRIKDTILDANIMQLVSESPRSRKDNLESCAQGVLSCLPLEIHVCIGKVKIVDDTNNDTNNLDKYDDSCYQREILEIYQKKSIEPFVGIFCDDGRLPQFFRYPAKTSSGKDLGEDSDIVQSPGDINGILQGRLEKYFTYTQHLIRIPRALAVLQGELNLLFNCSS